MNDPDRVDIDNNFEDEPIKPVSVEDKRDKIAKIIFEYPFQKPGKEFEDCFEIADKIIQLMEL